MLIAHYGKYNILNDEIIERIIFADNQEKTVLNGGTEVNILHGARIEESINKLSF